MGFGPLEIGIIVLIVLLLFGARKLPEMGKGLGSGMREFKDGITGESRDEPELPSPEAEQTTSGEATRSGEKSTSV